MILKEDYYLFIVSLEGTSHEKTEFNQIFITKWKLHNCIMKSKGLCMYLKKYKLYINFK